MSTSTPYIYLYCFYKGQPPIPPQIVQGQTILEEPPKFPFDKGKPLKSPFDKGKPLKSPFDKGGFRGIPEGSYFVLSYGCLCALVSPVPRSEYNEEALKQRLQDLEWTQDYTSCTRRAP